MQSLFRNNSSAPLTEEEIRRDLRLRIRTDCMINGILVLLVYCFAYILDYSGLFGSRPYPANIIAVGSLVYVTVSYVLNEYFHATRIVSSRMHLLSIGILLYCGNLLAITFLIHFAGGVNSMFPLLYMILAMVGSFLLPRILTIALVLAGSLMHGTLLYFEYLELIPIYQSGLYALSGNIPRGQAYWYVFAVTLIMTLMFWFFGRQLARVHEAQRLQIATHRAQLEGQVIARTQDLSNALENLKLTNISLDGEKKKQERFFAHFTHQFRTPIHIITNFVGNFLSGIYGDVNDRQTQALQHIHSSSHNLLGLVNNLLDMSKLQSGKMSLQLQELPMTETVTRILESLRPLSRIRGIELEYEAAQKLPESIHTDRVKFESILTNLLHNAIKFSTGKKVVVRAGFDTRLKQLQFQVEDFGPGIAEDRRARIFEPFEQFDAPKEFRGSGLGLSIAGNLAEMLGGSLGLREKSGPGALFQLTLPVIEADTQ